MLKKKILLILAVLFVLSGCATPPPTSSIVSVSPILSVSPNWDYIAFNNLSGYPNDPSNAQFIGNAILKWEESHPDRVIVSLQIIQQQDAYITSSEIEGISIYSQPKSP